MCKGEKQPAQSLLTFKTPAECPTGGDDPLCASDADVLTDIRSLPDLEQFILHMCRGKLGGGERQGSRMEMPPGPRQRRLKSTPTESMGSISTSHKAAHPLEACSIYGMT